MGLLALDAALRFGCGLKAGLRDQLAAVVAKPITAVLNALQCCANSGQLAALMLVQSVGQLTLGGGLGLIVFRLRCAGNGVRSVEAATPLPGDLLNEVGLLSQQLLLAGGL